MWLTSAGSAAGVRGRCHLLGEQRLQINKCWLTESTLNSIPRSSNNIWGNKELKAPSLIKDQCGLIETINQSKLNVSKSKTTVAGWANPVPVASPGERTVVPMCTRVLISVPTGRMCAFNLSCHVSCLHWIFGSMGQWVLHWPILKKLSEIWSAFGKLKG